MNDEQKSKCHEIADYYGSGHQALKAIEEMAELQKELAKYALNDNYNMKNITEELADVCIMIEQLKYCMIPADVDLNDIIWEKLDRQLKRMRMKTMANVCDEYTEIDVGECTCENCMTCDDNGINMTECMAMHGLIDPDYFEKE